VLRHSAVVTVTAVLLAFLAGCAGSIPPPTYKPPMAGLLPPGTTLILDERPIPVREPLGVILSDNIEAWLAYLEEADLVLRSYGPLTNVSAVADADPTLPAHAVLGLLQRRFSAVEIIDDFNEATAKRKATICVIDIQGKLGERSGDTTRVTIELTFFDGTLKPVSAISTTGTAVIGYPAWEYGHKQATALAVSALDAKLNQLLVLQR